MGTQRYRRPWGVPGEQCLGPPCRGQSKTRLAKATEASLLPAKPRLQEPWAQQSPERRKRLPALPPSPQPREAAGPLHRARLHHLLPARDALPEQHSTWASPTGFTAACVAIFFCSLCVWTTRTPTATTEVPGALLTPVLSHPSGVTGTSRAQPQPGTPSQGLVQFSRSVVSNSLQPHGLQHARPPCPSPTPGVYSNSCPLSQWCHPTISSSAVPFSCRLQSFPASGSFLVSQFFPSGGQSTGVSVSASVLPVDIQDWFPLGQTGWISLQSKGLSRVQHDSSKASNLQRSAFFMVQLSHPYMTTRKTIDLITQTFAGNVISLLFNMLSSVVISFLPRSWGFVPHMLGEAVAGATARVCVCVPNSGEDSVLRQRDSRVRSPRRDLDCWQPQGACVCARTCVCAHMCLHTTVCAGDCGKTWRVSELTEGNTWTRILFSPAFLSSGQLTSRACPFTPACWWLRQTHQGSLGSYNLSWC